MIFVDPTKVNAITAFDHSFLTSDFNLVRIMLGLKQMESIRMNALSLCDSQLCNYFLMSSAIPASGRRRTKVSCVAYGNQSIQRYRRINFSTRVRLSIGMMRFTADGVWYLRHQGSLRFSRAFFVFMLRNGGDNQIFYSSQRVSNTYGKNGRRSQRGEAYFYLICPIFEKSDTWLDVGRSVCNAITELKGNLVNWEKKKWIRTENDAATRYNNPAFEAETRCEFQTWPLVRAGRASFSSLLLVFHEW